MNFSIYNSKEQFSQKHERFYILLLTCKLTYNFAFRFWEPENYLKDTENKLTFFVSYFVRKHWNSCHFRNNEKIIYWSVNMKIKKFPLYIRPFFYGNHFAHSTICMGIPKLLLTWINSFHEVLEIKLLTQWSSWKKDS